MLPELLPALSALTDESLSPLFWRPTRLGTDSAWFGHVPFAHWIVGQHRPRSIVELGTHNGVSYAAFCEAVLRERLDARAMAVDTWQGDEHAGFYDDSVYVDLVRFHDQRYSGFSTLIRATFNDALPFVADGSVDLLHIDGRHRYEDVAHDFATWLPKLSPRGVVLFHDTNVRAGDFGVFRLWAELRAAHPGFEFLHGHGLGVLAVGPEVDGTVAGLCGLEDAAAINTIRERFALLGERWIATRDLMVAERIRADLAGALDRTKADLAATQSWATTAQNEVNTLFPQLQALTETHRQMRANLARARYDVAARERELAELRAAGDAPRAAASSGQERPGKALAEARAMIAALEQARADMLASSSWRLTAPLRRLRGAGPDGPVMVAQGAAEPAASVRRPSILLISGEGHTPGSIYRVERYVAAARALGLEAGWCEAGPVGPAELEGARLVVLWRVPYSSHIAGIIQVAHEQGATVIFDVDDLMFRPELATIEVIDGIRSQRFSEQGTQEFFRLISKTLRACDLVTCPTEELAHQVRLGGRPAYVLPNGFDAASHAAARRAHVEWLGYADDLVRIGYAGGSRTHQRDFAAAAPAIARVLRAHPQVRLTLFRDGSSGEGLVLIDEFPEFAELGDRIEWRNMVKLADLPGEIARFAINIAPLEHGNPFCESKSELKFFEAALAGVPTVASPTGPFKRAIEEGVTGFLAEDEEAWFAALSRLVGDAALRAKVAQAAYHVSLARFGPEAQAGAFGRMLAQIEGGAAGAAAFEQDRYRASLPAVAAPFVPDSEVLFARDRMAAAQVCVIVPVFNYADYVTEALQSVADQTLELLDLVVVEDCSPDDSGAMVLDWVRAHEERFNRIRVLRHRENAGLGFARNSGFAAAETPFVLPLDADNRLRPKACETLLEALSGGMAAFAYPRIQKFGDSERGGWRPRVIPCCGCSRATTSMRWRWCGNPPGRRRVDTIM